MIHDVVATTQEIIHSIQSKQIEALLMKIDLRKVYDCIDWAFLCMLLMKIGLSNMSIEWIMGCISNAHFFVLINGKPTRFFTTGRGLKQGCALSPLLFILVMDYLSLKIHRAIRDGFFKGIKIVEI